MKNRFIVYITVVILALCATVFCVVGCGSDAKKVEYSVTVLSPDLEPVEGVTVAWKSGGSTFGSAKTGADGVAKASIPSGTYKLALSDIGEGMTYDEISVTSSTREITLQLEVLQVTYTVSVLDKDGAAAANVTVTWNNGTTVAGTATTGVDGTAQKELPYGNYSVTVSDLPADNVFTESKEVTGASPAANIQLAYGQAVVYTVTVRSEGGLKFANKDVFVYNSSGVPIHSGKTDASGMLSFSMPVGDYTADTPIVQEGYAVTTKATLTSQVRQSEIVLSSEVIIGEPESDKKYVLGDIIHDYSFTTPYKVGGAFKTYSIAEILETKKAIIINNWGMDCSWCVREMPAMQEAYEQYGDDIEILAINNFDYIMDSDDAIVNHRESNNYTFPMMRDTARFGWHLNIPGWPMTVVVDKYGAIARIESGAITDVEIWGRLIEPFIADGYVQTFVPGEQISDSIVTEVARPDVTVTPDHYQKIAAAINKFEPAADASITWHPIPDTEEYEYAWPFVLETEEGVSPTEQVLCSSNAGRANSYSMLSGTVKIPVGKVFTFEYYADTEENNDVFSVVWNGKVIKQISGNSDGWKKCYLYSEIFTGEHTVYFTYMKDSATSAVKDNVYLRNIMFEDVSVITEPTDMLRAAAYGEPEENAKTFPYYAEDLEKDTNGYYHVKLSGLQNSQYAGNDPSPMLFMNMLNVTNWENSTSINRLVVATKEASEEYLFDCRFTVNGVTRDYRADIVEFCRVASTSDLYGYLPVDDELLDVIKPFMERVSGNRSHANEWLEACYFYSHYGTGETIGNPLIGLTKKSAIPVENGTFEADMTRNIYPFPTTIYSFTPTTSSVYKIESLLAANSELAAQAWLYDENGAAREGYLVYSGENRLVRDGRNEHNFEIYYYLTAGTTYYLETAYLMSERGKYNVKITDVGTATVLLPASDNVYSWEDGSLLGAVDYVLHTDGYYHVKNADGSVGGFIYMDVKYATTLTAQSISKLVDQNLRVPTVNVDCGYKMFDFRKTIAYSFQDDGETSSTFYDTECDLVDFIENVTVPAGVTRTPEMYKDYTEEMKAYIAKAETGENDGLVKVDEKLAEILTLFIETRINMIWSNQYELALENEWLRFCWYYHTYSAPTATTPEA